MLWYQNSFLFVAHWFISVNIVRLNDINVRSTLRWIKILFLMCSSQFIISEPFSQLHNSTKWGPIILSSWDMKCLAFNLWVTDNILLPYGHFVFIHRTVPGVRFTHSLCDFYQIIDRILMKSISQRMLTTFGHHFLLILKYWYVE